MAEAKQDKALLWGCLVGVGVLAMVFVIVMSLVGFWAVIADGLADATSFEFAFFSVAFLVWGYLAYKVKAKVPKVYLGIGALAVAVVGNWVELQKLAEDKNQKPYEHFILILASIAVAAHGFKQLHEAKAGKDID